MEGKLRSLWSETRELNLGTSGKIDRLPSAPSTLQFLRDYVSLNKPCIISSSDTAARWPALSRSLWSSDAYLRRALCRRTVSLHLTPTGRADSLAPHPRGPTALSFAYACVRHVSFPDTFRLISFTDSAVVAYTQQQKDCFLSESKKEFKS